MLIEICSSTYQSAVNAQKGGAQRIELCENLSVGGLTPSRDLIARTLESVSIKTFVLIRPRAGNFVYSSEEFKKMLESIDYCKSVNIDGIVSGVLNSDNSIDIKRTMLLIEASRPLSFTFHRAFDDVPQPIEGLEQLVQHGADRILTSGQASTAIKGIDLLKKLKKLSEGKLTILPGGGVRSSNLNIFKNAGFTEVHSSAIVGSEHSDLEEIKEIVKLSAS